MSSLPPSVVVTGAASGIGLALARHLVAHGVRVIAADRDAAGLKSLVEAEPAGTVASFVCDVASPRDLASFFREAAAIGYEGAVNCAGTEGTPDHFARQSPQALDGVLDVNVRGTVHSVHEEIRHMLTRRRGSIVNLASIYGLRGQPRWAVYSASKAAIVGLTQGVALEVAQSGIRVNAVAPGPIETPLLSRSTGGDFRRTAAMVPMKRNGTADEVVQAIAWLLGDASSFTTGAVLPVDGGMVSQAATAPEILL